MRPFLLILVMTIVLIGYLLYSIHTDGSSKGSECDISIIEKKINLNKWKEDSLGCNGYREDVNHAFIELEEDLKGWSRDCIKRAFGPPNLNTIGMYSIGWGPFCFHEDVNLSFYSQSQEFQFEPSRTIWIVFEDDSLKEVQWYTH